MESAARLFKLAQEAYRQGLSAQIPMLVAAGTLREARQKISALAAHAAAQRITLFLAMGGDFDRVYKPGGNR